MKNTCVFIFPLILTLSCSDDLPDIDTSLLLQSWTRSYEEETTQKLQIYRPSDFQTFPLTRFRNVFHLKPNGQCDFFVLAPNDAHYYTTGSWQFNAKKNILSIEDQSLDIRYKFKVLEVSENLLSVEALERYD